VGLLEYHGICGFRSNGVEHGGNTAGMELEIAVTLRIAVSRCSNSGALSGVQYQIRIQ